MSNLPFFVFIFSQIFLVKASNSVVADLSTTILDFKKEDKHGFSCWQSKNILSRLLFNVTFVETRMISAEKFIKKSWGRHAGNKIYLNTLKNCSHPVLAKNILRISVKLDNDCFTRSSEDFVFYFTDFYQPHDKPQIIWIPTNTNSALTLKILISCEYRRLERRDRISWNDHGTKNVFISKLLPPKAKHDFSLLITKNNSYKNTLKNSNGNFREVLHNRFFKIFPSETNGTELSRYSFESPPMKISKIVQLSTSKPEIQFQYKKTHSESDTIDEVKIQFFQTNIRKKKEATITTGYVLTGQHSSQENSTHGNITGNSHVLLRKATVEDYWGFIVVCILVFLTIFFSITSSLTHLRRIVLKRREDENLQKRAISEGPRKVFPSGNGNEIIRIEL